MKHTCQICSYVERASRGTPWCYSEDRPSFCRGLVSAASTRSHPPTLTPRMSCNGHFQDQFGEFTLPIVMCTYSIIVMELFDRRTGYDHTYVYLIIVQQYNVIFQ